MSTFVWLDYSERERRKMLDVVDLFREHDTRDELGLGSVRDAFADMLFPGTSTIMTRARYFLLVPWTYQRLERQRVGSAEIATRAPCRVESCPADRRFGRQGRQYRQTGKDHAQAAAEQCVLARTRRVGHTQF